METEKLIAQIEGCFQDPEIRERSYYPEFRRRWMPLLENAIESEEMYFDTALPSVFPVRSDFAGVEVIFHFDQLKIDDWYRKEQAKRRQTIFRPQRLTHGKEGLKFHEVECSYDPEAEESALNEGMRNIVAAAMPSLPARMSIVYGNKWVESRFNSFFHSRLSVFLLETDYVPAFLSSPAEVGLYLFLMDCCITKENCKKVKDDELKPFLHIFRPSPMLVIKKLIH